VLACNRDQLQRAPSNISCVVPDDLLGWTVDPNRRSKDGLYFSSSEDSEPCAKRPLRGAPPIRYEDLTSCLSELSVSELFIEGRPHYSLKGNAKVATCLHPVVRDHLVNRGRHS